MILKQFNEYLNSFTYGAVYDGSKCTDLDNADWDSYRTLSPEEFEEFHMGICWDFINYQHRVFQKLDIPDKSYFYIKRLSEDPTDIVTHTFSTLMNDAAWFESCWYLHKGIHKISSVQDVFDILEQNYPSDYPGELYEYDASKTIGLSNQEFFNMATALRVI